MRNTVHTAFIPATQTWRFSAALQSHFQELMHLPARFEITCPYSTIVRRFNISRVTLCNVDTNMHIQL
jgi:hypothetical protein